MARVRRLGPGGVGVGTARLAEVRAMRSCNRFGCRMLGCRRFALRRADHDM